MDNYISRYHTYERSVIYDFKLGDGGIADYVKFFMIMLMECIRDGIRIYHKVYNIEIEKYIKFKYDFFNITASDISKLNNYVIRKPGHYYRNNNIYNGSILLNEVFIFDNSVLENVKHILPSLPTNYISIHLRMGDKYLETNPKFISCIKDVREFQEEKIYNFIEDKIDNKILLFCDNWNKKLEIQRKYNSLIITNAEIAHTSNSNTNNKQVLDTVTEFYILSNSELICAASKSGFSEFASKFNGVKLVCLYPNN